MNSLKPASFLDNMEENASKAETMLKLLANRHRLMILCHLVKSEKTVGELNACLSLSQPALSQHLAKMRLQGLVSDRKEGQSVFYKIASKEAAVILSTLYELYCQ